MSHKIIALALFIGFVIGCILFVSFTVLLTN